MKNMDSADQGQVQAIDLMPQRWLDICVSQFHVTLAHYTIQELFLKMFSSLLIFGSDALDNPVEFSLLDCWLLPDAEC